MASIETLPFELLSAILQDVAGETRKDAARITYGMTGAHQSVLKPGVETYLTGQLPPDASKWLETSQVRQVHPTWHSWAVASSLRDLYITRWRGSERWSESKDLASLTKKSSGSVVYRDPFCSLKKTLQLFSASPDLATHVRRAWFHGFYTAETSTYIFELLRFCTGLKSATLPWIALRHGSAEDWSRLLKGAGADQGLSSLELLAVDLKAAQMANHANARDERPLANAAVDFSELRRLKLFGDTNFLSLGDDDLKQMSPTLANLEELHITGTSSITIAGVNSVITSARNTLRVLEFSPLSADGFERPDPSATHCADHCCALLLSCPRLQSLSISVPALCPALFARTDVRWSGELQIRAAGLCGQARRLEDGSFAAFREVLGRARALMEARAGDGVALAVEIFVANWIFEPRRGRVHGNFDLAEVLSDGTWPMEKGGSGKGPYGYTGLYGKDEGPYSTVSEEEFEKGLQKGYVSF